ncbi:MAG: amidohydrolase family protein, partial [Deltaproteobacteria bacterium]|nr:amidohydrolase family protein [Deltaproteobacteria bacterium]
MPVIDFHVHVTQIEEYKDWFLDWARSLHGMDIVSQIRETTASPEALLRFLDSEGVDYAVVLAENNPMVTGVCPNERVATFCKASDRLIPFASINPYITFDAPTELERCVTELGFRGLKLYPTYQHFFPNDSRLFPLYERAQGLGIPVIFHTGSSVFPNSLLKYGDPLTLDEVA